LLICLTFCSTFLLCWFLFCVLCPVVSVSLSSPSVLFCVLTVFVSCCDVRYVCHIKTMFGSSLPQLFVGWLMSYLCYLCLLSCAGVQCFLTILVTWWMFYKRQELLKPFVSTWLHLRFLVGSMLLIFLVFSVVVFCLFVFVLCLVYQMLTVSLGCPFLVAPSIISNVYLSFVVFTMRKLFLEINKRLFYLQEAWYSPNTLPIRVHSQTSILHPHSPSAIRNSLFTAWGRTVQF